MRKIEQISDLFLVFLQTLSKSLIFYVIARKFDICLKDFTQKTISSSAIRTGGAKEMDWEEEGENHLSLKT